MTLARLRFAPSLGFVFSKPALTSAPARHWVRFEIPGSTSAPGHTMRQSHPQATGDGFVYSGVFILARSW
jgi:hypothetical protein